MRSEFTLRSKRFPSVVVIVDNVSPLSLGFSPVRLAHLLLMHTAVAKVFARGNARTNSANRRSSLYGMFGSIIEGGERRTRESISRGVKPRT